MAKKYAPDNFSFEIRFDPAQDIFVILPPRNNPSGFVMDRASTLEQAYATATRFSLLTTERAHNHGRAVENWRPFPKKGTIAFSDLQAAYDKNCKNPTTLTSLMDVKTIIKKIKDDPYSELVELFSAAVIKYIAWKKYGRNTHMLTSVRDDLQALLKRTTGVSFVPAFDDDSVLLNPDTAKYVLDEPTAMRRDTPGPKRAVTTLFFHKHYCPCSNCKTPAFKTYMKILPGRLGDKVCLDCFEELGFYSCEDCGGAAHNYEETCPRYEGKPLHWVFNYGTDVRKIIPQMFSIKNGIIGGGSPKMLRYGVELEVIRNGLLSYSETVAQAARVTRKYGIIKADSSIGSDGFEIVTAPATLEFHRNKLWNDFFTLKDQQGLAPAQYVNAWNTGVCGTHIHITRDALTKMQLAKLLVFYHEDHNLAFLSRIAGRAVGPGARYCKTRKKKLGSQTFRTCHDHHEAIAISDRNNGKTAEVRIFRANATKHGVMRSLEFVDATVKWCGLVGANDITYINFLKWFDQAEVRAGYPDLWKHLIQLGYLKTAHVSKGKKSLDLVPEKERIA
jgi:hypothetical protein